MFRWRLLVTILMVCMGSVLASGDAARAVSPPGGTVVLMTAGVAVGAFRAAVLQRLLHGRTLAGALPRRPAIGPVQLACALGPWEMAGTLALLLMGAVLRIQLRGPTAAPAEAFDLRPLRLPCVSHSRIAALRTSPPPHPEPTRTPLIALPRPDSTSLTRLWAARTGWRARRSGYLQRSSSSWSPSTARPHSRSALALCSCVCGSSCRLRGWVPIAQCGPWTLPMCAHLPNPRPRRGVAGGGIHARRRRALRR